VEPLPEVPAPPVDPVEPEVPEPLEAPDAPEDPAPTPDASPPGLLLGSEELLPELLGLVLEELELGLEELGLELELEPYPPDAPELLGEVTVPVEEPEPEPMPEVEPEVLPEPVVPHADSTSAHAKGMVHLII
jgi:hypothetical protein